MHRAILDATMLGVIVAGTLVVPAMSRASQHDHAPARIGLPVLDPYSELAPCLTPGQSQACTLPKIDVDQKLPSPDDPFRGTVCRSKARDFGGLRSRIARAVRPGSRLIFEDQTDQIYVIVVRMIDRPEQYYRAELETVGGGRCFIRVGAQKIIVKPPPDSPAVEDDERTQKILDLVEGFGG